MLKLIFNLEEIMKKLNSKGFGIIEGLLIVLVIGLVGGGAYYVGKKQNSNNESAPTTSIETSPKTEEKDPNKGYLVVKQWDLRFKAPKGLKDIKYRIFGDRVAFYAKPTGYDVEYRSDYEKLSEDGFPEYAIGQLIRSNDSSKGDDISGVTKGKKIGNYYYYTSHSFSSLASGAGPIGTFNTDASCDTSTGGDKECEYFSEAETKAFSLVNGNNIEEYGGGVSLLESIEQAL